MHTRSATVAHVAQPVAPKGALDAPRPSAKKFAPSCSMRSSILLHPGQYAGLTYPCRLGRGRDRTVKIRQSGRVGRSGKAGKERVARILRISRILRPSGPFLFFLVTRLATRLFLLRCACIPAARCGPTNDPLPPLSVCFSITDGMIVLIILL